MINVEVRDADGTLLHTYEMIVDEYGTLIKAEHLLEMAKMNAVEDEIVPKERIGELVFKIVE